ncbi:MAG TPA: DUF2938 domain-containing protein [Luteimonas sp.]|nr:DUF2938 domain-containing protein [Luteimonas sp.]
MDVVANTVLVGVGATALIDAWSVVRWRLLGVPLPNYALVGRWIGHMRHGRFRHDGIGRAMPVAHEAVIGWSAHYAIGIAFASLLPALRGAAWFGDPTLLPAAMVGIGTVLAPFLLMQPGMGAGIAARRNPRPAVARMHSLVTHAMFGLGLYVAARLIAAVA